MKRSALLLFAPLLTLSAIAQADVPYGAQEKNTVLKELRKICTPQAALSDEAWEKVIMSDKNNAQHIREAIVAMKRNNQHNYWEALGKVECPDM
ncbi:hypothetical protein C3432_22105 [Citrobacter amalonaticus]|uniref:Uncharacterized protein YicS n=1 Tax=Citrobacter amalonaticus TaxID=35703 RepID=A0A2S4RS45_CITAM|nr:YicS family protein [Citrobacter amalonaticus]POT55725.1 hypothetical protein C3432_22105 [Citrobacter amalonaticus]POT73938.1 hypothetical protein C3436_19570 [Citrobacter amalonaticus]POU62290.1 hypothetical protein C3430_23265 [Citrobacter amalonaticus]POV02792.1 hypothetical protein C3424_24860 [Citrobacter amalonaticus]